MPILCPVLIDRDAERAALRQSLEAAHDGAGQTVLIGGEAGVGKSRLMAATKTDAAARGFRVIQGNCFQPDVACPYAPILDLIRAHVTVDDLGPEAGALHALLPDLAPRSDAAPALDPEQERRRLFAALVRVVLRLAERQPLVIVVEDVHWSDDVSLEWLHLLMRRGQSHPLLLLLTYRTDEPHSVLNHWLATIDRARLAQEITLEPLAPDDVAAMLRAIFALARSPLAAFRDAIYDLSGGNPFAVEEILAALVASGEIIYAHGAWTRKPLARLRVPRGIQDAVQQRCAGLSDAARRLLDVAAVAGRRFDLAVLRDVTGHDEAALLPLLKEVIAAHLVVEESADRFAFRHALTREAIAADLLARERQTLHAQIATAIERLAQPAPSSRLPDLAHHFFEAAEWPKALDYARRAADQAQFLDAPRAVAEQATRALTATDRLGQSPDPDLLRSRARAYETLGDFDAARTDFAALLGQAQAIGDRRGEWQAQLDLGFLWTARDYAQAHAYFEAGLALSRAMDDPSILAHSLNRMGNWYANHEEPDPALQHHEEALAIFERLGDKPGIAATLDLLGMARGLGSDAAGAAQAWEQATVLFREQDDRQAMAAAALLPFGSSPVYEYDTAVAYTKLADALPAGEPAVTMARDLDWPAGEAFALAMWGEGCAAAGEFGDALELLRSSLAIAEEIEHHQWMVQAHIGLGGLHADLLALPTAHTHVEQALTLAEAIHAQNWIVFATGSLASVLVAQGELMQAEAALSAFDPEMPARTIGQRLLWCARAELALTRNDPERALAILDRLYATAANLSAEGDIPRLARLKAQALTALEQPDPAMALLQAAQARATMMGTRPALWRLHAALAGLFLTAGRRDEAAVEAEAARALIAALAQTVSEETLRTGFLDAATAMLPAATPASARRAAKAAYDGLTAREREVAGLVARGQTNRAIAAALSVSERTVEAHVANILQKLDASARSQIAAWAVERGLTRNGT
ncbi:MAG: helix-turn-helix transcriptional regulator [Thermomicrobiales bacterium]